MPSGWFSFMIGMARVVPACCRCWWWLRWKSAVLSCSSLTLIQSSWLPRRWMRWIIFRICLLLRGTQNGERTSPSPGWCRFSLSLQSILAIFLPGTWTDHGRAIKPRSWSFFVWGWTLCFGQLFRLFCFLISIIVVLCYQFFSSVCWVIWSESHGDGRPFEQWCWGKTRLLCPFLSPGSGEHRVPSIWYEIWCFVWLI